MKTFLRVAALIILLAAIAWWCAAGMNRGWTKNSVPHKETDPVTQLTVDRYEDRFVPGVDFLAGGLFVSGLLAGASFLFRKKPATTPH